MNEQEQIDAGLYDPATHPDWHVELVERALGLGVAEDEIRDSEDLVATLVFHIYGQGREALTSAEVAERAGVPLDDFARIIEAVGWHSMESLGDLPVFNEVDVAVTTAFKGGVELLGEEAVLRLLTVAGSAIARIGDAAISTFLTQTAVPTAASEESGLTILDANMAAAEALPEFGTWLAELLVRYVRLSPRPVTEDFLAHAVQGVDAQDLTIGFADLAGSTTHAEKRSLAELNASLEAFEGTAHTAVRRGGGRVVKFIGDEVMFRAGSPLDACRTALDLVESIAADERLPPLRVGLASGKVLGRDGDYYGSTVNLAARITKLAPLQGVLIDTETAAAIADDDSLTTTPLGAIEMQGVAEPVELAVLSKR